MPNTIQTLVIDDEWEQMDVMWYLLRHHGLDLEFAKDDEEARKKYTENFYDLIVIDALLGRDFNIQGQEPSGVRIYHEIRRYSHARCVPLVILTNYLPRVKSHNLEATDTYLKVLSKGEDAEGIVGKMRDLIEQSQQALQHERDDDLQDLQVSAPASERWPNNYPMYVSSGRGYGSIMVQFVPSDGSSDARMLQDCGEEWRLNDELCALLTDPTLRSRVLMMKPRYNPHHLPLGLIYLSDSAGNPLWYEQVLFETAPRVRRGVTNRDCFNCGLALTGRFLLECLYRRNLTVRALLNGSAQLEPKDTTIRPIGEGRDFLTALGFRPFTDQPDLLFASNYVSQEILRRVSHPSDR